MKLSEIAEHIAKINPDCYMVYNGEVIPGCRESWYEESLIDSLVNYYMFDVLHLCGCGNPEDTYEAIRRYLHIRKLRHENKDITWDGIKEQYKTQLCIDVDNDTEHGVLQFMMYVLDHYDFTEHGSSIGGCWLTEKGEMLLTVLDAWHEKMENEE